MEKIATDIHTFSEPRDGDFTYVDKTDALYAVPLVRVVAQAALAVLMLCACPVLGRTVSLDLRKPTVQMPRAMLQAAAPHSADGTLRRVDLDAGAADVGEVDVGDELELTLFDDVKASLRLVRRMSTPLGGDAFIARVAGYDGVMNAVVLRTANGLTVDVQDFRNRRVYTVVSTPVGVAVREIEPMAGTCGNDSLVPPSAAHAGTSPESAASSSRQVPARPLAVPGRGSTYVDILVAYEGNAVTWANENGGGITNFAEVAVQKMNMALANTGLDALFSFRLVGVLGVNVSSTDLNSILDDVAYGSGGWAPVKQMRDNVSADIVTILVDTGSDYGMTGLGWSLREPPISSLSEYAYNACSIRSVAQAHTMTHEVGHNMGAGHSDLQRTSPGPQYYSYSSGYYFTGADENQYGTVMTYNGEGPGGEVLPYFSSPNYVYAGVPIGDDTHDNTRTIAQTYAEVALFRSSFTVEFNANGGELEETARLVRSGAAVGSLPVPARSGYELLGWFTAAEGGTRVSATTRVNANVTFYARWRFVGAADETHIYLNLEDAYATEADGTFSLALSELVESYSAPKLTVSGLPSGLKYDATAMAIRGKAAKPGVYTVTLGATNATVKKPVSATFMIVMPNFTTERFTAAGLKADDNYILQGGVAPALRDEIAAITDDNWKLAVAGLPSGVKYDAKNGLLSGIATKEGFYTVTFTATRGTGKTAEKQVATATFKVVFPTLSLKAAAWEDASATGKMTGGGKYPAGKKVTLKATPEKGSVFMGWYDGLTLLSQAASWPYVTTDADADFVALFATTEEDGRSIALSLCGTEMSGEPVEAPTFSNYCGVAVDWPLEARACSATTVKAAGLPSGVKLVQDKSTKAYSLAGAPTAASKTDKTTGRLVPSQVKLTVTTAGKSTRVYAFGWTILPRPDWAVGTFDGASVTLAVATNGKISGKLLEGGKTWTLSAAALDSYDETGDAYSATIVGKSGKEVITNAVTVTAKDGVGIVNGRDARSPSETGEAPVFPAWIAWQNLWKRSDTKASQPVFKKSIVVEHSFGAPGDKNNTVKITFKKDGVVSFSGKKDGVSVSGSAQLVRLAGDGSPYQITFYAPPKPKAKPPFDGWCETFDVKLTVDEQNVVTAVKLGGAEHAKVQLWEGGPYWATRGFAKSRTGSRRRLRNP